MNRRELIKCIAALSAMPAVLLEKAIALPPAYDSVLMIKGLWINGIGKQSAVGTARLIRRPDTMLIQSSINVYGGCYQLIAAPGYEMYFVGGDTPLLTIDRIDMVGGCWGRYGSGEFFLQTVGCEDEPPVIMVKSPSGSAAKLGRWG